MCRYYLAEYMRRGRALETERSLQRRRRAVHIYVFDPLLQSGTMIAVDDGGIVHGKLIQCEIKARHGPGAVRRSRDPTVDRRRR